MNKCFLYKNCIGMVIVLSLLSGCAAGENSSHKQESIFAVKEAESKTGMLTEAETDYEVPYIYPGISVDLNGYDVTEEKKAIIKGDTLPAYFEVVDCITNEVVFSGAVAYGGEDEKEGKSVGLIDFTELEKEGKFFIKTEILGKSRNFSISNDRYASLLSDFIKRLDALKCEGCHFGATPLESSQSTRIDVEGGWHTSLEGEKDVVEGCLAVLDLCTAFEYYPKAFADDSSIKESGNGIPDILDEVKYEAEWLFKMQNPETGGVYTSVSMQTVSGDSEKKLYIVGETTRATAYYCATMAKLSSVFKKYDSNFSAKAYQAALLSWNCLEANKDILAQDQMYRAAVELYRISGSNTYADIINEYLKANASKEYESRIGIDAAITYLSTSRMTNVEYCTDMMSNLMTHIRKKVDAQKENFYLVESEELTPDEVLRNAFELIVVDYINSSNEYVHMEENNLHYVCGRNRESRIYADELISPDSLAKMIGISGKLSLEAQYQ